LKKYSDIILAIESSCDDTSAAIVADGRVLSNITATQSVHEQYGGVIPELASRQHIINIIPVIDQAVLKADISLNDVKGIAFTQGPGLLGSLIVGVSVAKSLALGLNIPLISVHHMRAHIMAHFAEDPTPQFPFLCLTVSGGHTQIVLVNDYTQMEILGTTIDDAAGEAFDKAGKMLGLDYPAGPIIDKLAQSGRSVFSFAKPKIDNLDYSFSGLKTSILYFLQKEMKSNPEFINHNLNDLCASIQTSIVDVLFAKLIKASKITGIKHIGIAGGVSANSYLRSELERVGQIHDWVTYVPAFQYCTDNAGMIGISGYYQYLKRDFADQSAIPLPRMVF